MGEQASAGSTGSTPAARTRTRRPARLKPPVAATLAVLLALPVIALLWVPLYSRKTPELWGFPFFYWWQLLWVFIETVLIYLAYLILQRARRSGR